MICLLLIASTGTCRYAVPSSSNDSAYLAAARSEAAAREPWSWPVVVRGRANTTDAVDATHFAAIDDGAFSALAPVRGGFCSSSLTRAQLDAAADALDALAGVGGAIAVGFVQQAHPSTVFGHVWNYVYAFYCALVRPRRHASAAPRRRELTVYLPAGSSNCSSEHKLLLGLFGGERARRAFGLRLERAPWVPEANTQKAWSYAFGGVPAALRGRVSLLSNFRNGRAGLGPFALAGPEHAEFRADVWKAVGVSDAALPQTVLYVRSTRWPTKRAVADEEAIVRALAAHVASEHPRLRFVAAHAHELSVAAEVALFANARLVISLWGSALHNCRFMKPGTTLVEIYGALNFHYGDTTLYHDICSGCGVLHAPLIVRSSFPRIVTETLADGRARVTSDRGWEHAADKRRARVNVTELRAFVSRVFPADPCASVDWESVHAEYNAYFVGRRNPNNINWTMRLVHDGVWARARSQFPQFAQQSRWCRLRHSAGRRALVAS